MNFELSAEYLDFQSEVHSFLAEHAPSPVNSESLARFRRRAIDAGYLLRSVPRKYGGSEQPPDSLRLMIVEEEFRKAGLHTMGPGGMVGESLLVPTLLAHGSDWQKAHFIPPTLAGEYIWAQGYSEQESGSDLASLRTRAELDGNEWVVNGQKIWSTNATRAHFMFALVRTEPNAPRHKGLSFLLIDMKSPGVTARPLEVMTGATHFGEVFLDDVRVPMEHLVGDRGDGWRVGNTTLASERNAVGSAEALMETYNSLVSIARGAALGDPVIQDKLLAIEGFVQAHRLSGYRQLTLSARNESTFPLGLMNKLSSTEIGERMARLAMEILGPEMLVEAPRDDHPGEPLMEWRKQFYWSLGYAIAGGTSNIQKNIIAEKYLKLPRDYRGER